MAESPAPSCDNPSAQSTETHVSTGELSMPQLTETHTPTGGSPNPRLVRIHVLCPSLPAPNRFTVETVPLSSTVAQLKSRITELVPSQPPPDTQRLIFRGKILANGNATISDILGPHDGIEITIHLVLPVDQRPINTAARSSGSGSRGVPSEPRPNQLPSSTARESPSNVPRQRFRRSAGREVTADLRTRALAQGVVPRFGQQNPSLEQIQTMIPRIHDELVHINNLLDANILPSTESLFHLQTQAQQIHEVLEQNFPRDPDDQWGLHSTLLHRIMSAYRRIDSLIASAVPLRFYRNTYPPGHGPPELYLIESPSGYQGLIVPGGTTTAATSLGAAPGAHQAQAVPVNAVNPAAPVNGANPAAPGQGPAMMDNLVGRAVQQQQGNDARGLLEHFRRILQFGPLYVLCFYLSESGTWTRVILLSAAIAVALFSESRVARQFHDTVFERALLHLEQLAHVGGPAGQPVAPQEQNNGQAGDRPADGILAETWQTLRRLERAGILLLASLIPGVGERQVQARVAAEEAERVRRVEQAEEQQREPAQGQTQGEQAPSSAPENAGAGHEHAD